MNPQEQRLEKILTARGIEFTRPERDASSGSTLDYYLPAYDLSIEVKHYSTPRLHEQIVRSGMEERGVMVLIGMAAVEAFGKLLTER